MEEKKNSIPKLLHYIWFVPETDRVPFFREFSFWNFLSIASGACFHPDHDIYLHTNMNNDYKGNQYWQLTLQIPRVHVRYKTRCPKTIENCSRYTDESPMPLQYAADIVRLEILLSDGGIYLDTDIVCFKSLSPLTTKHKLVLGGEGYKDPNLLKPDHCMKRTGTDIDDWSSVGCQVILSPPEHPFLIHWREQMNNGTFGQGWAYHSVLLPLEILKEWNSDNDLRLQEIQLMPPETFLPMHFKQPDWLFEDVHVRKELYHIFLQQCSFAVHLWETWGNQCYLRNRNSFQWLSTSKSLFAIFCKPIVQFLEQHRLIPSN